MPGDEANRSPSALWSQLATALAAAEADAALQPHLMEARVLLRRHEELAREERVLSGALAQARAEAEWQRRRAAAVSAAIDAAVAQEFGHKQHRLLGSGPAPRALRSVIAAARVLGPTLGPLHDQRGLPQRPRPAHRPSQRPRPATTTAGSVRREADGVRGEARWAHPGRASAGKTLEALVHAATTSILAPSEEMVEAGRARLLSPRCGREFGYADQLTGGIHRYRARAASFDVGSRKQDGRPVTNELADRSGGGNQPRWGAKL